MADEEHAIPQDPPEWLFKRDRNGEEHITKCADGYDKSWRTGSMPDGAAGSGNNKKGRGRLGNVIEIHHVACISTCKDTNFPTDISPEGIDFIKLCLAVTNWNINDAPNTIGLPRKWAYVRDPESVTGWDGYACHQVDHDRYRKAVEKDVRENVWAEIARKKKTKKCKNLTGENVAQLFTDASGRWKPGLSGRATKASMEYCRSGKVIAVMERTWHLPFSMKPDQARERMKPPSVSAQAKLRRAGLLNAV